MLHNESILRKADDAARDGDLDLMYSHLRMLSLADFCLLHHHIDPVFNYLKAMIPRMPSEEIQKNGLVIQVFHF